jgi:GH35 family endo-1,4-beta-xylanase
VLAICSSTLFWSSGLHSQTVPSGSRLKDITESTRAGARPNGGPSGAAEVVSNREFDAIQPTWYPNFGGWTGPYAYNFNQSNFIDWVNWASSRGRAVHTHVFAGPNLYLPSWFVSGTWSNSEMDNMYRELIRNVIQNNQNNTKVRCWNMVNEAFTGWDQSPQGVYRPDSDCKLNQLGWEADASGLSGNAKVNASHPNYIRLAFQYARQYTNAKLELREYGIEYDPDSVKGRSFYQLAVHLLNKGAPLDAIGLQGHQDMQYTYDWDGFKRVVKKFKALGLEVNMTEFDSGRTQGWDAETQAQTFYEAYRACREVGVEAFFTWGIADKGEPGYRDNDRHLPFDENYNPKPSYYGIQRALNLTKGFLVRARGNAGGEQLNLLVDDRIVETWFLSREWSDYCYTGYSGSHNVKLSFSNDGNLYGRDKNVQVDYLRVNGNVRQAENQASNTGNNGSSEWMFWNGRIDFGTVTGPVAPLPNGNYRITPRNTLNKALDIAGNYLGDSANAHIWTYLGASNQEWSLTHVGNGWYEIKARHSGLALDVNGGNSANGTNVQQWSDNDSNAQRWRLDPADNGWFRVTPMVAQDKCLDVAGGVNAIGDGTNVHIWQYGGAANQQWKFEAF